MHPPENKLATVATFSTPFEAHVLRAQLEAEGLFAVVADEHLVGTNQLWSSALGGVRVQVPSEFLAQAKEIMAATQEGAFSLAQDEDEDSPAPSLSEQETALLAYAQAPYWLKVWQPLIKKPGFFAGFNFFAMLFGPVWCLLRKMYLLALIVFLAEWLAVWHLGLVWLWLALRLVLGVFGNGLYFMQALNALEATRGVAQEARLKRLKQMGGINVVAALLVPGLLVIIQVALLPN